jgi:hypothetical protein
VIKDFTCVHCDYVHEDILVDGHIEELEMDCPHCGSSVFVSIPGGLRSRWRFADLGGVNWRDYIRLSGAGAKERDENGKTLKDMTGSDIAVGQEELDENLAQTRFEADKKKGKTPIWFDKKPN